LSSCTFSDEEGNSSEESDVFKTMMDALHRQCWAVIGGCNTALDVGHDGVLLLARRARAPASLIPQLYRLDCQMERDQRWSANETKTIRREVGEER
jgi:hypothetical protein